MSNKNTFYQNNFSHTLNRLINITISTSNSDWRMVFRHSSCGQNNYERLEFLGDRVLGLCISELLFILYPNSNEGNLAKRHAILVSTNTLDKIARHLEIDTLIEIRNNMINSTIRADVIEALLAYLYLHHGLSKAKHFIFNQWQKSADKLIDVPIDSRSKLQEMTMKNKVDLPKYYLISRSGPDHKPVFLYQVQAFKNVATGTGQNKQQAKISAAQALLKILFA